MAIYTDDVLEEVRNRNEIVDVVSSYVKLRQKGGNYFGLCPFHNEKSPSFSVSADKQIFHCFGCGAGGNVISFIMRIENIGFGDAVIKLADRAHYTLPEADTRESRGQAILRERLYEAHVSAARFYHEHLMSDTGAKGLEYLKSRRINGRIIKKFGLGYAPPDWDKLYAHLKASGFDDGTLEKSGLVSKTKNGFCDRFRGRLIFPILDPQNRVVGFGGRIIGEGEPKYLNSADTPIFSKSRNLFALNFSRKTKSSNILVVEGYMDVITLWQAGFDNAVATLGTALNKEHCRVFNQYLKEKTAILLFDGDTAGINAAQRAIPILGQYNVKVKVLRLPGAKDPDEYIRSYGPGAFTKALEDAKTPTAFRLDLLRERYGAGDETQVIGYLDEAAAVIAELDNPIEGDVYINLLSKETGVTADAIRGRAERKAMAGNDPKPRFRPPDYSAKGDYRADVPEGVMAASRNVLYWLATHINFYDKIQEALSAEEFPVPLHIRIAEEIYRIRARDTAKPVSPGELVGRFEDEDDQKAVAAMFTHVLPHDGDDDLKSALNQHIQIIKSAYINNRIEDAKNAGDFELMMKLGEIQRKTPVSYI